MAYITQRRRSVRNSTVPNRSLRRSPVRVGTRTPHRLAKLNYPRIIFLIALLLTVNWTVGALLKLLFPPAFI